MLVDFRLEIGPARNHSHVVHWIPEEGPFRLSDSQARCGAHESRASTVRERSLVFFGGVE